MLYFSNRGYHGVCVEYPGSSDSVETVCSTLHEHVLTGNLVPPIMVAHSMSTFAAQKYLESFALSALVLVNPIPPKAQYVVNELQFLWSKSFESSKDYVINHNTSMIGGEANCSDAERIKRQLFLRALYTYYGLDSIDITSDHRNDDAFISASLMNCGLDVSEIIEKIKVQLINEADKKLDCFVQPFFQDNAALKSFLENNNNDAVVNLEPGAFFSVNTIAI